MRAVAVICLAVCGYACDGGGSSRPTAPSAIVQPVVTTPPVTTTPPPVTTPVVTPTIANYAGYWSGQYIIERCSGQGSLEDLFCSLPSGARPGGIYPPGTRLPITFDLSQNGSSVSGLVSWGQVRGTFSGTVRSNNLLTMNGSAAGGPFTMSVTYWDTGLSNGELTGYITFQTQFSGINGFASVETRLTGVRR